MRMRRCPSSSKGQRLQILNTSTSSWTSNLPYWNCERSIKPRILYILPLSSIPSPEMTLESCFMWCYVYHGYTTLTSQNEKALEQVKALKMLFTPPKCCHRQLRTIYHRESTGTKSVREFITILYRQENKGCQGNVHIKRTARASEMAPLKKRLVHT